ncbi:MAG: 4Fe-4S dicluster domain-containing protein [Bacteroidales bacterium]|nr:4Fe-4S dicluster domain-containing protein [Bacteroidales bacterium]
MSQRIDPNFTLELEKFGISENNECFHCGTCTAACSLTEKGVIFPRKQIRAVQMGLKDTLASSVEPWLCYFCGDCNEQCPRDAKPGELMMSLRRYLTSVYDWTGLSKLMYKSKLWEFIFIFLIAAVVLVLSIIFMQVPAEAERLTSQGGVALNKFAPVDLIHLGDMVIFILLGGLLISNAFNMYYKVILKPKVKVSLVTYIKELGSLIWNFGSQWRFRKCDGEKTYWIIHLLLMSGYVTLLVMIVVFLSWFQTDIIHPWYHPQRILGYYATFGLMLGVIYFMIKRFRKISESSKNSHFTDWTFLVLLLLTTITGILVHIFRINGLAMPTYYMYVFHLMVLTPMLLIEVPFSKWSHLAYRPLAIYFANLKKAALKKEGNTETT